MALCVSLFLSTQTQTISRLTTNILYRVLKLIIGQNCTYRANLQGREKNNNNNRSCSKRPAGITDAGMCQELLKFTSSFGVSLDVSPLPSFLSGSVLLLSLKTQMFSHLMCLYCCSTGVCDAFFKGLFVVFSLFDTRNELSLVRGELCAAFNMTVK